MPFKSKAQQRFMFADKKRLAKQGVDVDEWASKTDFKKLPEKAAGWATEYFKVACLEPADLKHGTDPDSKFDHRQLVKGMAVEKEHTEDPAIAKAIVKGHLAEFQPHGTANRYYPELEKIEDKLKTACWATEYFQRVS